jgi:hypothetical protein
LEVGVRAWLEWSILFRGIPSYSATFSITRKKIFPCKSPACFNTQRCNLGLDRRN